MKVLVSILVCFVLALSACGCQFFAETPEEELADAAILGEDSTYAEALDDLPEMYETILADYAKIVEARVSPDFEEIWQNGGITVSAELEQAITDGEECGTFVDSPLRYRWSNMIVEMTAGLSEPNRDSFGQRLIDLNDDGFPELLWVRGDGSILAIFTMRQDKLLLVDAFWPRHKAVLTNAGYLYTKSSGGASQVHYVLCELASDARLSTITAFGIDDSFSSLYYEMVDGEKVPIEEERFEELLTLYPFAR